jgi:hypothetical protein
LRRFSKIREPELQSSTQQSYVSPRKAGLFLFSTTWAGPTSEIAAVALTVRAIAITGVIGGMADALARRLRMGSIGILIVDDVAKRRSAAPFKHCLFDPYLIGIAGLRTQDFHRR